MKGYRHPFFTLLHRQLADAGVSLLVQYGKPWPKEALRGDNVTLEPPIGLESPNLQLLGPRLLLQPTVKPWWGADLVVIEHASKHLHNHVLTLLRHRAFARLAYWGHGLNRQGNAGSWTERFKRRSLHWADWWFAYTAGATAYVKGQGFPAERITTVENAVDTRALREAVAAVSPAERASERARLQLDANALVGIFVGSLYEHKRLDWLISAGRRMHAAEPRFRLIVAGGGPQAPWMRQQAACESAWLSYEGPQFDAAKARLLAIADLWLNPGLVGLGVLDSFAAGLPMITTDIPLHSPEIEYLQPGVNGDIAAASAESFAEVALATLREPSRLAALKAGAVACGHRFSIETMARNFTQGVLASLALDPSSTRPSS